jgi:tetratricopeptide (TPR) repeat protein
MQEIALMKKLLIVLALLLPSANIVAQHQPPPEAREEVEMGLKAHRQSHFEEATQHFQRALAMDNDFCWARLYLASSFGAQYVPHVESADNLAKAKQAYEHYQTAMKCDPALSTSALRGMAYLKVLMEQPAEARDLYRQLLKIEGDYRDTYYAIAMCDLAEAEANTAAEKARLGLKVDESLASDPVCPALRKRNLPLMEDGLQMLSKAMWLHTSGDGGDQVTASVLYLQRAEIECGDPAAKKAAEKNAAEWNDMAAKATNKQREAAKQ